MTPAFIKLFLRDGDRWGAYVLSTQTPTIMGIPPTTHRKAHIEADHDIKFLTERFPPGKFTVWTVHAADTVAMHTLAQDGGKLFALLENAEPGERAIAYQNVTVDREIYETHS